MSEGLTSRDALRLGEIELHADAIGIVEKELRIAAARHDALAELHVVGLQALAHALDIARGKSDVVEPAGIVVFFLGIPRTTMPSRGLRVPIRCTVATPPE